MDVIGVQLPGSKFVRKGEVAGGWDSLRSFFLHLDTVFSLVDTRRALTVPYFLEEKYATPEILKEIAKRCPDLIEPGERTWEDLREIGRVRRYAAKTGEVDRRVEGMKLVDYLRTRDFEFLYVGGPPPDSFDVEYLRTRAIPEAVAQGTNVLALKPRSVVAFEGNPFTIAALKGAGIDVKTFPCSDLVRWHGGPHCLSMPLERGAR